MKIKILFSFLLAALMLTLDAQKGKPSSSDSKEEGYKFTPIVELKATPVKDQAASGTCWSFATTSFIESELLRMGRGEYDLSVMYVVRNNLADRMKENYKDVGKGNFEGGGQVNRQIVPDAGIII